MALVDANAQPIPPLPGPVPLSKIETLLGLIRTFRLDLSVARNNVKIPISGTVLWIADANTIGAVASISAQDPSPDAQIPYRLGSFVRTGRFDRIFVTNTAQGAGAFLLITYLTRDIDGFAAQNSASAYTTVLQQIAGHFTTFPDFVFAGVGTQQVLAANGLRFSALVTNLVGNNATPIRIGDSNTGANRGQPVGAGQTGTFDCQDAVFVWSPVAQSIALLELNT